MQLLTRSYISIMHEHGGCSQRNWDEGASAQNNRLRMAGRTGKPTA